MKFSVSYKPLDQIKTDALITFAFADKTTAEERIADKFFGKTIARLRSRKDFTGEKNKVQTVFLDGPVLRLLIVGLGNNKEFKIENLREAISQASLALKGLAVKKVSLFFPVLAKIKPFEEAAAIVPQEQDRGDVLLVVVAEGGLHSGRKHVESAVEFGVGEGHRRILRPPHLFPIL